MKTFIPLFSAFAGLLLNANALAAGGSQDGAYACAVAIAQEAKGYTHVKHSTRANFTVEEFWLTNTEGGGVQAYCQYDRTKQEVRKILMIDPNIANQAS